MSALLINISKKQAYLFAGFLVFFEFLTYVNNDMIMPAMLTITHAFQAPPTYVASSLVMYLLGGASLQLFLGPISDTIGRRPVMMIGTLLFFMFTLYIGFSQSIHHFLTGRFFQGMGLCFLIVGYATIQEMFQEFDAVRLIALLANVAMIAPLLGPLMGTLFILHWNWRILYWITAFCTLIAIYGIWRFMPETIDTTGKQPHLTPKASLHPFAVIKSYVCLLTHGKFMMGIVALGCLSIPCLAWIGLSPLILMSNAKLSLIAYALWQMPFFGACILGNFFLRWLTHHHPLPAIIQIGSVIAIIGLGLMLALPLLYQAHYLTLIPGLLIYGLGLGTTVGPLTRYILFSTDVTKGTANALINVLDLLLMGLGTEAANVLYHTQNNLYFGGFCALMGALFYVLVKMSIKK
jgi:DHA1 family multidrug/chloramphenicol efflux transport protein-like MFS transporter